VSRPEVQVYTAGEVSSHLHAVPLQQSVHVSTVAEGGTPPPATYTALADEVMPTTLHLHAPAVWRQYQRA
jgi:hypothetical protein